MFLCNTLVKFFFEKYLIENVENTISEPLVCKRFWESMPPEPHPPPPQQQQQTVVSGASFLAPAPQLKLRSVVPVSWPKCSLAPSTVKFPYKIEKAQ